MKNALDSLLISHLFHFPFVLGVFEVRHGHKLSVIVSTAIVFDQLDGED
jgi:hypothetical protein